MANAGIESKCAALEADALPQGHRLVGLVVKASASRAGGPGFQSRWGWDFFGV